MRKGKGVVHLTVLAEPGKPVQTLCERTFEAGEYTVTDLGASCTSCLRRQLDPSRISNAMFGQDLGTRLLELSLSQPRKRPEDEVADERAARAEPPRLRIVTTAPRPSPARPDDREDRDRPLEAPPRRERPRPAGLDLTSFEQVGQDEYRSPGGVLVRILKREGGGWDVAEVEHDGPTRLEQLADGRVRVSVGDLQFEYSGDFERRLRLL